MPSLPRLYAILDVDTLSARGLDPRAVIDIWLDAGIRLVQLRAKSLGAGDMVALADDLVIRTRAAGATLIINDRVDIAMMVGADGVHIGQDDLSPEQVRDIEHDDGESDLIVGLSTHTLDQFRAGLASPVDYLAVGPVFSTTTKIGAEPAVGLSLVTEAAAVSGECPLVAIGGITLANAPSVLAAGADSVAVISDLLNLEGGGDLAARARAFVSACE